MKWKEMCKFYMGSMCPARTRLLQGTGLGRAANNLVLSISKEPKFCTTWPFPRAGLELFLGEWV